MTGTKPMTGIGWDTITLMLDDGKLRMSQDDKIIEVFLSTKMLEALIDILFTEKLNRKGRG